MLRKFIPVAAALLSLAGAFSASAGVVFSTRGDGITQEDMDNFVIFISDVPILGATVEDGTFGGSAPFSVDTIRLGYYNDSAVPISIDALVTFYDTVSFNTSNTGSAVTTPIGSQYRLNFQAAPGKDGLGNFLTLNETGLMPLTGGALNFPDSTFGIKVEFVNANTNTHNNTVVPIFHNVPLTVGTSNELFFADWDGDGTVSGTDWGSWRDDGAGFPAANLYVELSVVPEPGTMALLAIGAAAVLQRRRGN
jgi:hypothetical protein